MTKVFISYRRADSELQAGRLFDRLSSHFGADQVFMDTDSKALRLGLDFRQVLREQVGQCDVLLALIGDNWLNAGLPQARRLDDEIDPLRREIEYALQRGIPVIPVLVGKSPIPKSEELPAELKDLAYRHGISIRTSDFNNDVAKLIEGIASVISAETSGEEPAADAISNHPRNPKSPSLRQETLVRIGILKSGNASYVNEIEGAFLFQLAGALKGTAYRHVAAQDCVEWKPNEKPHWAQAVNRLLARGGATGFNYLVAIGTQAAMALSETLGNDFGQVPTLLLGVTYPRLAGLVDSVYHRSELKQVAGVRYGCGLDAVASLLHHRLFPGRTLCFVYQKGIPQDEMAYSELASSRLVRQGVLQFKKLSRGLKPDDLADAEWVYFSWYTFTRLFYDKEFSILSNKLVVSIMQDNVRDGVAVLGIGTDHGWIGARGSELVAQHLLAPEKNKPDWGALPVEVSPLVYWINKRVATARGIEFSQWALDHAGEVFV